MTETADPLSGDFSQTQAGTTRYGLLEGFNDVSNTSGTANPGNVNLLPFGVAFVDPEWLSNYWDNWVVPVAKGAGQTAFSMLRHGSDPLYAIKQDIGIVKQIVTDPVGTLEDTAKTLNAMRPEVQLYAQYKAALPNDEKDGAYARDVGTRAGNGAVNAGVVALVGVAAANEGAVPGTSGGAAAEGAASARSARMPAAAPDPVPGPKPNVGTPPAEVAQTAPAGQPRNALGQFSGSGTPVGRPFEGT